MKEAVFMDIILQRIYDDVPRMGYRVLVDRLWPRGVSKGKAALDEWCKDLAPSAALRTWFGHSPAKWDEFSKKYKAELRHNKEEAQALIQRAGKENLVLLYGAKDEEHCHARVLKDHLSALISS